jgi:GT2 family glycosyltransferase
MASRRGINAGSIQAVFPASATRDAAKPMLHPPHMDADPTNIARPKLPIGIVVLHYHCLRDTDVCVTSLLAADPAAARIVIVNNVADPETRKCLFDRFGRDPRITLRHLDRNHGFAGGMNHGIQYLLLDSQVKVLLLLNNDTRGRPDFLGPLAESLSDSSAYQLATPKILFDDRSTIWSTGEWTLFPFLFSRRQLGKSDDARTPRPRKINSITGCAMAVRREVFERIGMFDENFFAYVEDVDFCLRAWKTGFRFACCHDSVVYHAASQSLGDFSPAKVYLNTRNKAYFIIKNVSPFLWLPSAAWYLAVTCGWFLKALCRGDWDVMRSILQGFVDGIRNRMGTPQQPINKSGDAPGHVKR